MKKLKSLHLFHVLLVCLAVLSCAFVLEGLAGNPAYADFFEISAAKAFRSGTFENLEVDADYCSGALILAKDANGNYLTEGTFVSKPIEIPASTWFAPAWNMQTPEGTWAEIYISARIKRYDGIDASRAKAAAEDAAEVAGNTPETAGAGGTSETAGGTSETADGAPETTGGTSETVGGTSETAGTPPAEPINERYWTEFLPVKLVFGSAEDGYRETKARRLDNPDAPRAFVRDGTLQVQGAGCTMTQVQFRVVLHSDNPKMSPVVGQLSGTTARPDPPLFPITNGFTYIAVLVFLAAMLVTASKTAKRPWLKTFFKYLPPVVLLYLGTMLLCSIHMWDLKATEPAYNSLKNNLLYAMLFLMLLNCDLRRIIKLGPRMLLGFFTACMTVVIGFLLTFLIMHNLLGLLDDEAWAPLASLCGSWIGGSGNMVAIQSVFSISSAQMANALVVDTVNYSLWVMFLFWTVSIASNFNRWTKADTQVLDAIGQKLATKEQEHKNEITFSSTLLLVGMALFMSVLVQHFGAVLNGASGALSFLGALDKATWTVLLVTVLGMSCAVTPLGRVAGSVELANVFLYIVIALLASRASLAELENAPAWIISGTMILLIHGTLLVLMAKLLRLDLFTSSVASLANIGGVAGASLLAGAYSAALVPIAVLMAFMGTITGTFVGIIVGVIMRWLS